MTPFAATMAWRETRAAWRHFTYFFLCIALGVGALVAIGLFAANVEQTVTREARALMGGDLEVRLSRPISEKGETLLRSLKTRGVDTTHISELVAMVSRNESHQDLKPLAPRPTQIVELKAVEAGYPFYGVVQTTTDRLLTELLTPSHEVCHPAPSHSLTSSQPLTLSLSAATGARVETGEGRGGREGEGISCYGAVVQESLLIKMGLAVHDQIKIGLATFTITGVLRHEPDRAATAFSLGPRVMISQNGLAAADLVKPGSRVRERWLLRIPPAMPVEALLGELRGRLQQDSARVSTYRDAQPQLRRFLDQLTRYLGLIGLTALFVGGIGVASTIHAFLQDKLKTIAILKTLGADSRNIIGAYLFQALALGAVGSLAGIVLGVTIQGAMPALLSSLVPPDLLELTSSRLSPPVWPIVRGFSVGLIATLLFAAWPLLGIREVRPALVFRETMTPGVLQDTETRWQRVKRIILDRPRWMTALALASGLAALAIWQAGSWSIGLLFIGALVAAVVILYTAAMLLMRALKRLPAQRSVAVRHAVGNLYRPGSHAPNVMVSVGIGVMIIVTISLLERSLVREVGESRPMNAPTFFFIDIQPDQQEAFRQLIQKRVGVRPEATPLVRSRLHAVNGRVIALNADEQDARAEGEKDQRGKSWYFTREYVLTFLDQVPKDNEIVNGHWWSQGAQPATPLVSVEEEAAKSLGLDVGSTVEFDIQGATLAAEVSNIRKVEWNNFSTNFYMILSPGALEGAPFTYVATVRVKPEEEVPVQQAVVAAFPNVTAINIGEVMETFSRILEHLSVAIRTVAIFCILAGSLVMAAALAANRYRRLYESVVLKALGATRGVIASSFAVEYALMGIVAGAIGLTLAGALSWAVLRFFFEMAWSFQPAVLVVAFACTIVLTLLVGFLSTFRILGERPLAILRHE